MSTILEVLQTIVKFGGHQQLARFLESCDESRVFSTAVEDTKAAIAFTNQLLNENSRRRDGLLILKCLLRQISSDLMQPNIAPWLNQAVKGLTQKESLSTVILAADVVNILLPLSSTFAEVRKQIALTTISKILEVLYDLKDSPELVNLVLPCLQVVSKHYNKSTSSWKDKFEKFTLGLIEEDKVTVQHAARCYLTLAACGPPGPDMVNYKENWTQQFKSLSSALHLVLDRLFDNVNEIEQLSYETKRSKPNFLIPPADSKVPFLRLSRLTSQFVNIGEYMKVMLLGSFPVGKRVEPEQLLSVVCRGLAVTIRTLQSQVTSDSLSLTALIPQLHSSCLSLLQSLITSCRTNLLSYAPVISKLMSQVLKSTEVSKSLHGQHKPYRYVRAAAYNCLQSWLTIASCSSNVEKHPELIDCVVEDIQFKKPPVSLILSSKTLKGKMGKKQRQALVNQTINNKEEHVADQKANSEVCLAALSVIPPLLDSVSTLLSPQNHKDLQTAVTSELLLTQLNIGERIPLPYSDKTCRLALYKSFVALCQNYHPEFPPPLSFATQLISEGLKDSSDEIMRFCSSSLSALDKMLRPIGPTLSFPMDLPEFIFESQKRKNLSNRVNFNESVKSLDVSMSASFNGDVSLATNGAPGEASMSCLELDVNPLLVDPEMSDFDYSLLKSPSKLEIHKSESSPDDKQDAVDIDSSEPSRMDEDVIQTRNNEATPEADSVGKAMREADQVMPGDEQNCVPKVDQQDGAGSPKRKPDAIVEFQPAAKKLKTDDSIPTSEALPDDHIATENPSDVAEAPENSAVSAACSEAPAESSAILADDAEEEAMLSSFVDEVV